MEDVLDILQLNVDGNRICTERPLSVAEDAAFVIDTRELLARKDYLEDNIGNKFSPIWETVEKFYNKKTTQLWRHAIWNASLEHVHPLDKTNNYF